MSRCSGVFLNEDDTEALITWIYNGGETTRDQLKSYSAATI